MMLKISSFYSQVKNKHLYDPLIIESKSHVKFVVDESTRYLEVPVVDKKFL